MPAISRREALGLGATASLALADNGWAALGRSSGSGLQRLGYVVAPGADLDAWSAMVSKVFALQLSDRSAGTRVFRMDDHQYRLAIEQSAQTSTFGWEVADAQALDAMAARVEAAGVKVTRGSRALASQRNVHDLITLADPLGNGVEIFHGAALANTPFQPARSIAGFRTGSLGMGHVALMVEPALFEKTSQFYRGVLGFRVSDYASGNGAHVVEFLHINPREHSLVLITNDKSQFHHLMLEMLFMDDVGRAYDIVLKDYQKSIARTLGRHSNDLITSFYLRTPSGFELECGWGGLLIDPERWQAGELTSGELWGHDFMHDGQLVQLPFPPSPFQSLRAPLQVYGENFEANHRSTVQSQFLKTEPAR